MTRGTTARSMPWITAGCEWDNLQKTKMNRNYNVPSWMFDGYLMIQTCEGTGIRRELCTLEAPKKIAERLGPAIADQLIRQGIRFVALSGLIGGPPSANCAQIERNKPLARALKDKDAKRVLHANTIGSIFYETSLDKPPEFWYFNVKLDHVVRSHKQ